MRHDLDVDVVPRVGQAGDQRTDDDAKNEELRHGRIRKAGGDHGSRGSTVMAERDACRRGVLCRSGRVSGVRQPRLVQGGMDSSNARARRHADYYIHKALQVIYCMLHNFTMSLAG